MDQDDTYLSLWEHIGALRTTLLRVLGIIAIAFFLCFLNYESILSALQSPLQSNTPQLVLLSPLEGILMAFKVSFWIALVITSPIWLFVILQFVLPGLKKREKNIAISFAIATIAFATTGLIFAFYITIPLANEYLLSFNQNIGLNLWSLEHYLNYTLFLLIANAFAFELGAIGIFGVKLRYISLEMLVSKRRHAIVGAFVLGALLTPPDVLTQLLLAFPLIALYEGLILYARVIKSIEGKPETNS